MDFYNLKNNVNNVVNTLAILQSKIDELNERIDNLDKNINSDLMHIKEDLMNELNQTAVPLINSGIDASKPELRNYIRMIITEEFRRNS
jgi:FtsZ-binding cell division protein ZapB